MKAVGIIPARYGSTRFPGKPLAIIRDRSMIQHVYERCLCASELSTVIIATDDSRIIDEARKFSGIAMLTSKDCASGTDRIIEVSENMDADLYVNIQGDEPFIQPALIDEIVRAAVNEKTASCFTAARECLNPEEWSNPNVVKTVLDKDGYALYFSRSVIPYPRAHSPVYLKHLGIYAYKKDLLSRLKKAPHPEMELAESLEQLRILYLGEKIKVIKTTFDSISIDTPEDLKKAESLAEHLKI